MAEEATNQNASLETPQDGQPQATSARPEPTQVQEPAKPTNWQDDPAYREQQRRAAQRERERETRHQQEMAQLQAQIEALQTRDMSDEQRMGHEYQKLQRHNQQLQQELQNTRVEQARVAATNEMARRGEAALRKMGIEGVTLPNNLFDDVDNPDAGWSKILDWVAENGSKAQKRQLEQEAEEQRANQVDIGRGRSASSQNEWQTQYDKAVADGNFTEMYGAIEMARREGVQIRR